MSDDDKPLTALQMIAVIIMCMGTVLGALVSVIDCATAAANETQHSRNVQWCEVEGRSLDCERWTAWYVIGKCSCSVRSKRIEWELDAPEMRPPER